jgi:excisionase family DNA binding protein
MATPINAIQHHIEPYIDAEQAARILGLHPRTVRLWAKQGKLPARKLGSLWKFRVSWLDEWMNSGLESSNHPAALRIPKGNP